VNCCFDVNTEVCKERLDKPVVKEKVVSNRDMTTLEHLEKAHLKFCG